MAGRPRQKRQPGRPELPLLKSLPDWSAVLQVISGISVEPMAARHNLAQRIVASTGIVARRTGILSGPQFLGRIGRDQRFLHAALGRAQSRVTRRGSNA